MKEALEKLVDQIAAVNGYRWNIDFASGLCIRINFIHEDPLKSWFFDCCAPTALGLRDKMVMEFLPACRNVGMKIPGDEPKPVSCKVCTGELVSIRGRFPSEDKRIVCPTCQADKLHEIKRLSK